VQRKAGGLELDVDEISSLSASGRSRRD
jgi:hypothetical protein